MRKLITLGSLVAAASMAGCSNTSGNTAVACSALTPVDTQPSPEWQGSVFTIVMENKDRSQIIGNTKEAPFINSLAQQNAVAAGYSDNLIHPSEPNYLWMVAGENFGVLDDSDPASHHIDSKSHIADQLEAAGLTWKSYQQSMGQPCGLQSHGTYAAKHNPFVYFNDINGWDGSTFQPSQRCNDHVVDYSQLDADLAANKVPKYVFITPDLQNDMHDGSIAQGDAWLSREMPKILASDAFNKGGVIFLMWDEGSGLVQQNDDPPMIVISPHAKPGYVSQTPYNESSYLKTVQKILGVQPLPCDAKQDSVQTMDDLFDVSLEPARKNPGAGNVAAAPGTTTGGATTPTGTTGTTPTGTTGTTPTGTTPTGTTSTGTTPTGSTPAAATGTTTGGETTPTVATPPAATTAQ